MPLYANAMIAGQSATLKSGNYIYGNSNLGTSVTLGNGNLRVCPLFLPAPTAFSAIGAEFTVAGDAASLFRMAIYGDDGTGYPLPLRLDGGSISTGTGNAGTVATAGTPGVYMNTTSFTLPAGWNWLGGAVQGVTVTQPTMRTAAWGPYNYASSSVPSAGASAVGYQHTGATGTPPSSFSTTVSAPGSCPRIILRVA